MNSLEFNDLKKKRPDIKPEDISIESLDISIRTFQALKQAGVKTLGDIISHEKDFFTVENFRFFNKRTQKEIIGLVNEKGLKFKNQE